MQNILHSNIQGQGGIPFIVMHGYLGMSDNWKSFAKQMANIGYEVHALDLRNHGRSFHSEVWSYEDMVQDVVNYMNHHTIDKAVVLGHSMGGKVAMLLATMYPEKVERLIVADIAPGFYPEHHQSIFKALNAVDFSLKPSRSEVDEILSSHLSDASTKMFLLKSLYWVEPEQLGFRFNLEVFNNNPKVVGQALPEENIYNGPTLFIRGGASDYIQEKDFDLLHAHFPLAVVKTIPNAGHWLHAQEPQMFFEFVEEFLQ